MDIEAFLARIDYSGIRTPTAATLKGLHRAFLTSVPFENLDIHLGRPIRLDEASFFAKLVQTRRGGFCYEMNGLFAAALRRLGFDVTLLSARVVVGGKAGPEFDHMVLLVTLEDRWLADVGFGDSFLEPLCLDDPRDQARDGREYRVAREGPDWTMLERRPRRLSENRDRSEKAGKRGKMCVSSRRIARYLTRAYAPFARFYRFRSRFSILRQPPIAEWKLRYRFAPRPRRLSDFAEMCRYHQTSPNSHFTRHRICSLPTPGGRVTLTDRELIVTRDGTRRVTVVDNFRAYANALRLHFGIDLASAAQGSPRVAEWFSAGAEVKSEGGR
jgi:N-hydroxyarylamine O-acetyltransferase